MEMMVEIDSQDAPMVEMNLLRSGESEEFTRISLFRDRHRTSRFMPPQQEVSMVVVDATRSSLSPEIVSRPPEMAPVVIPPDEPFRLHVFVDRSILEVFVNGRQCLAVRVYPSRPDSLGVSFRSQGRDARLRSLDAWQMDSIYGQQFPEISASVVREERATQYTGHP